MSYPTPENESERVEALQELHILDTEPEATFDRLTEVASHIFDVPDAAVSLVDDQREWFKASCGWGHNESSREKSLCAHAIMEEDVLVIEDLKTDSRFTEHPRAGDEYDIRFYAGAPLEIKDDLHVGTLCIGDRKPRSFSQDEQSLLSELAGIASDLLDARRKSYKVHYLTSALEQADEPVLITDGNSLDPPGPKILWVNDAFKRMTGYDKEELLGESPRLLQGPETSREVLDRVRKALEAGESVQARTVNYRKDGTSYVSQWNAAPVRIEDGQVSHWVSVQRDVTEQQHQQERLRHKAEHDDLTGLLRRSALEEKMESALEKESRTGSLLYIDLDRFKQVNDSLGHSAGDELLQRVSKILRSKMRSTSFVARVGGDEFVIWLPSAGVEDAEIVAERVGDALEQPFFLRNEEVYVEASVGVVRDLSTYDSVEAALRDADAAMYRAKRDPGHSFAVHNPSMSAGIEERLHLDTALHRAVERGNFEPYFHPIVRLTDGTVHGCEVLARWRNDDDEVITPGVFLEIAEETGLIEPIGHQVIQEACRIRQTLRDQHGKDFQLALSGNFSRTEFFQPETSSFVAEVLREYDMSPSQFTMEVTERSVGDSGNTDMETVRGLKELGVRIEIDDFGTGHSSLHSLLQFPADGVKLDKEITAQLDTSEQGEELVQSILEMTNRLSLTSTAEGIENEQQLALLRALGCPLGQGYLFTRPVPGHALGDLIESPPWTSHWDDVQEDAQEDT